MKKKVLVPTLIIGALLTGSLALAAPGGFGGRNCGSHDKEQGAINYRHHEQRMAHRLEMMSTVLDLTAEQQQQIETLFSQQWQDQQQLREQMQLSRDALRTAQTADNFNEVDFRAKAAKQAELKTEMMVAHAKLKQQVHALLTPEQQDKADKLGVLMGRRGKGHHGGFGYGS